MSLITRGLKQSLTCEHATATKAKQHDHYSQSGMTSAHKQQTSTEPFYLMSSQWQIVLVFALLHQESTATDTCRNIIKTNALLCAVNVVLTWIINIKGAIECIDTIF